MRNLLLLILIKVAFLNATQISIDNWWEQFNDSAMNQIISHGMKENRSLMASAARVEQSDEYTKIIRSQLLPSLYGNLRVSKSSVDEEFPNFDSGFTTASVSLDARYKLDSWGEELQQWRSIKLSGKAKEIDHQNTEMKISINMVSLYFDVIYAKNQKKILLKQLKNAEDLLTLAKSRYEKGISSGFVLLQQKQQLASVNAMIPPADMQLRNTIQFLSAMTFIPAEKLESLLPDDFPSIPKYDGNENDINDRYDILAAKLREESAKAAFTKTKLSIVPSIDLTGSIGFGYTDPSPMIPGDTGGWSDNWTLGASISLPIYTGGAIMAGLKESRAAYRAAIAATEQIEKDAIRIVKNAYVTENSYRDQMKAFENQQNASEELYLEALNQYKLGLISYSDVLISLNSFQQSQITFLGSIKNLLNARLSVIEATSGKKGH